jgi:signal transduction histidine kinase
MLIIGAVHSRKIVILYVVCSIIEVVLLSIVDIPPHQSPAFAKVINFLLAYLTAGFSLLSIFKVQNYVVNETIKIEKIAAINVMITTMSHEINNPLSIAMGSVELLQGKIDYYKETEAINRSLVRIKNIVKRMTSIQTADGIDLRSYSVKSERVAFSDDKSKDCN